MEPRSEAVVHSSDHPAAANGTGATLDAIYRRVGWRILPLLVLGYMLAYVDRVNISFAKLQMQGALGLASRAPGHEGLWMHFGHGHQGFTLGPVTGRILATKMSEEVR